jgi:hypothetical protein
MRYITGALLAVILLAGCQGNDKKDPSAAAPTAGAPRDSAQLTSVQWLDSTKDFGKIIEGAKLDVAFRFRNTGNKPLVIEKVQPSCGCTVAEQPKEPIQPGQEGQIRASFNSQGRVGTNHKTLFVYGNMKDAKAHPLEFVVQVEKKAS